MSPKPLDRALEVYIQMTSRKPGTAELYEAARHVEKLQADGEVDDERLTVHALTFLRANDNVERLRPQTEVH